MARLITYEVLHELVGKPMTVEIPDSVLSLPRNLLLDAAGINRVPRLETIVRSTTGRVTLQGELRFVRGTPAARMIGGLWPPIYNCYYIDVKGVLAPPETAANYRGAPVALTHLISSHIPRYYVLQGGEVLTVPGQQTTFWGENATTRQQRFDLYEVNKLPHDTSGVPIAIFQDDYPEFRYTGPVPATQETSKGNGAIITKGSEQETPGEHKNPKRWLCGLISKLAGSAYSLKK